MRFQSSDLQTAAIDAAFGQLGGLSGQAGSLSYLGGVIYGSRPSANANLNQLFSGSGGTGDTGPGNSDFHRLFGDVDGNASLGADDFIFLRDADNNPGPFYRQFLDFEGNGFDQSDRDEFNKRFFRARVSRSRRVGGVFGTHPTKWLSEPTGWVPKTPPTLPRPRHQPKNSSSPNSSGS